MKQLSKTQTSIFIFGAILMVVGAGLNMVGDLFVSGSLAMTLLLQKIGACFFMIGSLCFATMQIMQGYTGDKLTVKRLRSIQVLGDIFFVLSGLLLMEKAFLFIYPLFTSSMDDQLFYARYIHNNWVVVLLVAAILEVYTTHRIAHEINKN